VPVLSLTISDVGTHGGRRRAGATHGHLHLPARCSVLAGDSTILALPTRQGVSTSME
jgi:hypothetical protein